MNGSGRVFAVAALVGIAAIVGTVVFTGGGDDPSDEAAPSGLAGDVLPGAVITAPVETVPPPELPLRGVHPPLRDIEGWLQSDVTSLEELRGQVVAVQFWTFGCSNCKATLEHLRQWYADHHDEGFEIVGVHSPEFSYEADVDNIVAAAAELDVTWPIALDPTKHTFHDWQEGPRAFWPRIYLLDRNGIIRYDHHGEGRYAEIEAAIRALLAEPAT
jgi:thiol-disulfide isomerase/thioredoxin